MNRFMKTFLGVVLAIVLSISTPMMSVTGITEIAIAATSTKPKATVNDVTLFVNYKTYQIKCENVVKKSTITYKSSKPKVATVNNKGIITPIATGSTIVSVSIKQNSKIYTSKISVTVENSYIKFSSKTSEMNIGDNFQFEAQAYGSNKKVSWSVSDKKIASINSTTGELKALKAGEVDVIATAGKLSEVNTITIQECKFTTKSRDLVIMDEVIIGITAEDYADDERMYFQVGDENVLDCKWGEWVDKDTEELLLIPKNVGTTTVTITSSKTSDKLVINVTVQKETNEQGAGSVKLTAEEIYKLCAPATAEVYMTDPAGYEYYGSGFFISSGILVTNYHVIEEGVKVSVLTFSGFQYDMESVLAYDADKDLAIICIDAVTPHLELNKGDINVGETVYAIGSPKGLTSTLTSGMVSAIRNMKGVDYVQTSTPLSSGNSGGPLVNAYGEVIGVNTFGMVNSQNLNFAVNVSEIDNLNLKDNKTAEDYYKASFESALKRYAIEDKTLSGAIATAQLVVPEKNLYGSLESGNAIDYYKINLPYAGKCVGVCEIVYDADFEDVYFQLRDINGNKIADINYDYDESGYRYYYFVENLPAGDYYIAVSNTNSSNTSTILYRISYVYK